MTKKLDRVVIILREVGEAELLAALAYAHVWLAESERNTASARSTWARYAEEPFAGELSTFAGTERTPEERLRSALELVDDHHGEFSSRGAWKVIEICGATLTPTLGELLKSYGTVTQEQQGEKVVARRP